MSDADTRMAAEWFAKQQSGAMTANEREAFVAWLAADESNRSGWAQMQATWSVLGAARDTVQISEFRKQALISAPDRTSTRRWAMAIAATMVLTLGAVLLTLKQSPAPSIAAIPVAQFETGIGERATHVLADGSQVILNTNSAVHVGDWIKTRRVTIDRGQVYFVVAKDAAKPFIVQAGDAIVTAVGTQFDVRRDAKGISVTLTEGRVLLSRPRSDQVVEMSAGSLATMTSNGSWRVQAANTATLTSWRDGRLIFDAEPLANVVDELNRYSQTQMSIADASLRALPISGVFRTGDVNGFARALQAYGVASASTNALKIELTAVK